VLYQGDVNASVDIAFVQRRGSGDYLAEGNRVSSLASVSPSWGDAISTVEAHVNGAACSFTLPAVASTYAIVGLSTDPTADPTGPTMMAGVIMRGTTSIEARYRDVAGAQQEIHIGTYAAGMIVAITYDGFNARWYIDGILTFTYPMLGAQKTYFCASTVQASQLFLSGVRFSPIAAINPGALPEQGQGGALNSDPGCTDISAWVLSTGSPVVAVIADGVSGTRCIRTTGHTQFGSKPVPGSVGKTYRASAWMRKPSGTGTTYLRLYCYAADGTTLLAYTIGVESVTTPSSWTRYKGTIVAPSGTAWILIFIITQYSSGTGTTEIQDARLEEVVNTDLLAADSATSTVFATAAAPTVTGSTSSATYGGTIGLLCQATWTNNTESAVYVECTIDSGGSRTSAAGGAYLFNLAGTSAGATGGTNNGDLLTSENSTNISSEPRRRVSSFLVLVSVGQTCYAEAFAVVNNGHTPAAAMLGNNVSCRIAAIKR
jgi:hypothetical protein